MSVPNQLLIGGLWRGASDGATLEVIDPATEQVVDRLPCATDADIDEALHFADVGFSRWRETDAWTRSHILRRAGGLIAERREAIAAVMTEEQGKPLVEARAEVTSAAEQFDWCADEARRIYGRTIDGHDPQTRLRVLRQPIGPAAAFSAWNFPALLPARKMAPALAAGNSIVVKPAQEAARTALCLGEALLDAGVEPAALSIVTGDSARISRRIIASPVIRKVSLTGSVAVAKELLHLCADDIKAVSMELGGHAPVLVFADCDLDHAARVIVIAKFRNAGQVCISPSRFYVQAAVYDEVLERVTRLVAELRLGPGGHADTDVGPLANRRRLEHVEVLLEDAIDRGASLLEGGRRPPTPERGFFFEPTVLGEAAPEMRVMVEEPFGPIAPFARFEGLDDGLEQANSTPYGLAGYVFTRDLATAHLAAEGLETGMVGVNNLVIATAEAPFGGVKQSGFGREGGTEGIEAYTVPKYVNMLL